MSNKLNKRKTIAENKLKDILLSGVAPSMEDIVRILGDKDLIKESSSPAIANSAGMDGQVIPTSSWNDFVDGLEIDLLTMYQSLDDAWNNLELAVNNIGVTIPKTIRNAEALYGKAARSVSFNGIVSSTPISLSDLGNIDVAMSSAFEIDSEAGACVLERSSLSGVSAMSSEDFDLSGEVQLSDVETINTVYDTLSTDIARSFTVMASSTSEYGPVTLELDYNFGDTPSSISRIEVCFPDSDIHIVSAEIFPKTGDTAEQYGSASGRNKVIIDAGTVNAQQARIYITKTKSTESVVSNGTVKYEYIFRVGTVSFLNYISAPIGEVVTDAIDLGGAAINTIQIDSDYTAENGSKVSFFIAKDTATKDVNDFRWISIDEMGTEKMLSTISTNVEEYTSDNPSKMSTGIGTAADIYAIKKIDGSLAGVDEGIDQLEVYGRTVVWASTTLNTGWTSTYKPIGVLDKNEGVLPLSSTLNYYLLSGTIYSDSQGSSPLNIIYNEDVIDYAVSLNDVDITSELKLGNNSISLRAGSNSIKIAIHTAGTGNENIKIDDMPGRDIMICRDAIVSVNALNSVIKSAAIDADGTLLVNHNPTGRNVRISTINKVSSDISSLRVKMRMERGANGTSPVVKTIYVTTGV